MHTNRQASRGQGKWGGRAAAEQRPSPESPLLQGRRTRGNCRGHTEKERTADDRGSTGNSPHQTQTHHTHGHKEQEQGAQSTCGLPVGAGATGGTAVTLAGPLGRGCGHWAGPLLLACSFCASPWRGAAAVSRRVAASAVAGPGPGCLEPVDPKKASPTSFGGGGRARHAARRRGRRGGEGNAEGQEREWTGERDRDRDRESEGNSERTERSTARYST
jgi:hypothetical protein